MKIEQFLHAWNTKFGRSDELVRRFVSFVAFFLEKFPKTLTIQTRFEIKTTQWMHVIVLFMAWPREFRRSRHNSNIYQNNCDIWSSWSGRGMITQYEMFLTSSLTPPEIFYTFVVILLMLVVRYFLQHPIRIRREILPFAVDLTSFQFAVASNHYRSAANNCTAQKQHRHLLFSFCLFGRHTFRPVASVAVCVSLILLFPSL